MKKWPQFKISLSLKLIILTTASILVTAICLDIYFIKSKKEDYQNFLRKTGFSIATTLAYNSEYGVLSKNKEVLDKLIYGIMQESNVLYCIIYDNYGRIAQSISSDHQPLPNPMLEKALSLDLDNSYLIQEFKPAHNLSPIFDISVIVTTKRFAPNHRRLEYFPGYLGIIEQIKNRLRIEGEVVDEKIGLIRVGISLEQMNRSIHELQKNLWTITLIAILFSIFIAFLLSRLVVTPLKNLVRATHIVARGNYSHAVDIYSKDEIGELSDAFNQMTYFLRKSRDQIIDYSKQLEHAVEDRTQKLKKREQELIRSEKFAAVGELVAGIAHELNNKLTPILGYIQIFQMTNTNEDFNEPIQIIEESATNAKKIVESLLKFSRTESPTQTECQLNISLEKTLRLVEPLIKKQQIVLEQHLDPNLPFISADESQISQVFLNILNNAIHATEENSNPVISIKSYFDEEQVYFSFSDNGHGINEKHLLRVFDPFFSTKKVGEGTGLGLSISYGIIKAHKGNIQLESEPHKGTTFIITLPRSHKKNEMN